MNQACDVFSFGIVLWEIRERKLPFEEFLSDDQIKTQIAAGKVSIVVASFPDHPPPPPTHTCTQKECPGSYCLCMRIIS